MDKDAKVWNVLWSRQQNDFHIETMDDTVVDGFNAFRANRVRQYILIATGLTSTEASEFTGRWRDVLHVRQISGER